MSNPPESPTNIYTATLVFMLLWLRPTVGMTLGLPFGMALGKAVSRVNVGDGSLLVFTRKHDVTN